MDEEDDEDREPCLAHCWDVTDSDGRYVCSDCGEVMPRHLNPDDCLDCGQCEDCIERTIAAAEEANVHMAEAPRVVEGRIRGLVDSYLRMGSDAERAGHSRRAAAYRAVANMLGVAVTGGEPIPVDFLARYTG